MSHSPEPWHDTQLGGQRVDKGDPWERYWEVATGDGDMIAKVALPADRERIVACVNFCEGIPTERLAGHPEGKILVGDGDRARVLSCLDACQSLNPAGIPGLISSVEHIVGVLNAAKVQNGWEDQTNILSTLEGALRGVKP